MIVRIFISFLIWLCSYSFLVPISMIVVPIFLACGWKGKSTLFGNRKYGRYGNKAMQCSSAICAWWFLCVRNPISNFGKEIISVRSSANWPWHYDINLFWIFWIKAGWKVNEITNKSLERTFVFRPYIKKSGVGDELGQRV